VVVVLVVVQQQAEAEARGRLLCAAIGRRTARRGAHAAAGLILRVWTR